MGLTLFWGMHRDGLHYSDGSVLDPRDGSVYHALMNLSDDGKELEVRGYLGIPMLGKSQTWYRLPDDAMKKEEVPKEMLAGDEEKRKAHEALAEKSRSHKKAKAEKLEQPADAESAGPADSKQPAQ
jgi:hypothetical protein